MQKGIVPDHAGYYWARSGSCEWYNLIVAVYGDSPFFMIDVLNTRDDTFQRHIKTWEVDEWGPEIVRPEWVKLD